MKNPCYFTDRSLQIGFNIALDSPHNENANSILTIKADFSGIETGYVKKISTGLATNYPRLVNHFKFQYQTVFSARFDNQDEDGQTVDETEILT